MREFHPHTRLHSSHFKVSEFLKICIGNGEKTI